MNGTAARVMRLASGWLILAPVLMPVAAAGAVRADAAIKPLLIGGRVLRGNELPGFAPKDRPSTVVSAEAWSKVAPSNGIDISARLRRAGFVAAVREDLSWTAGSDRGALSVVVRLGSATAARAEIGQEVRDSLETHSGDGRTYTPFAVSGIPRAHGFALTDTGHAGYNIVFADGPFAYWVGVGWGAQAHDPPTRAQLAAAALRLFLRVRGRPAP